MGCTINTYIACDATARLTNEKLGIYVSGEENACMGTIRMENAMKHALACCFAIGLMASSAAHAQATKTYTEPNGRFSLQYPEKWPADLMSKAGSVNSEIVVGGADAECWFFGYDRPEWSSAKPTDVRRTFQEPFTPQKLLDSFGGDLLKNDDSVPPKVSSVSVETINGWPVQFGEIESGASKLMVSVHARPGFEVRTLCKAYDKKDHSADFKAVSLSVASPRDAEWQTESAAWEAKKAEAAAANAAAEAAEAVKKAKKPEKKPN